MPTAKDGSAQLSSNMAAVIAAGQGGPEVLRVATRPVPLPGRGEVLIEVAAAGLNHVDLRQRRGEVPVPPESDGVLGLECAGRIAAVGGKSTKWQPGALVCALLSGGGYAQYCLARENLCLPLPSGINLTAAASLPEALFTAWSSIVMQAALSSGETLLVHGGSSGIGTAAIQIGTIIGATVLATAGSEEKCLACERLGAARGINYKHENFAAAVKAITAGRGADVILDIAGGSYLQRNLECLAHRGRLVQIAAMGGAKAEIDITRIMSGRLNITGTLLRQLPFEEKIEIADALLQQVWPAIGIGTFKPVVDRTFPLSEAVAAHRYMERGHHIGKIILVTEAISEFSIRSH